jgi:hypothetical protein
VDKTRSDTRTENPSQLMKLMTVQDPGLNPGWVTQLPEIFSSVGVIGVETGINDAPAHWAFLLHECGLVIQELIVGKTKNEKMAENLARLLPAAVEETRDGCLHDRSALDCHREKAVSN